jgi:hypothetical protein
MYGLAYCRLDFDYMMDIDLSVISRLIKAEIDKEAHERDIDMRMLSWQTAYLMNATGHFKHPIKPERLYKPVESEKHSRKLNKGSVDKEREKLKKRFNL